MANSLLTPTQVTRKALSVLHQKLNFIGSINRQYDSSFAQAGAKIGDTLKIRLPNEYTVRTGKVLQPNDTTEASVTLTMATQKGVDISFSSVERALSLDDFAVRVLEPAMARLAANIEADAFTMMNDVSNVVDNIGAALNLRQLLLAQKRMVDRLTPQDNNRTLILNTQDNVDAVDGLKGLFHDGQRIAEQYRDGLLGVTAGFGKVYQNTIIPTSTTGTDASNCTVNGASQSGSTITITNGSSKTFAVGDVVKFAGCNRVHPETKADSGDQMTFTVTAAVAAGGTSLSISPAIVLTGAKQNVAAAPTNGGAVTKVGGASQVYKPSLAFHRDAFTFVSADLPMPNAADMAKREVYDGISMRFWQGDDIVNDEFPARLDVLYGFKTIREQLACRILSN